MGVVSGYASSSMTKTRTFGPYSFCGSA